MSFPKDTFSVSRFISTVAGLLLVVAVQPASGQTFLFDLGAPESPTAPPATYWNNVTTEIGADDFGQIENVVASDGTETEISFFMLSRFNGANQSGTTDPTEFPVSATRDSLFGNTESFGGLENIVPQFVLNNLPADETFNLTFHASRTGVSDNRETRFTVTGEVEMVADLDAANNVTGTVTVSGVRNDAFGEIGITMTPGPNNDNGNHFTYLNLLRVDLVNSGLTILFDFGGSDPQTTVEGAGPATHWNDVGPDVAAVDGGSMEALVAIDGAPTDLSLFIDSRFNGVNTAGTISSSLYPAKRHGRFLLREHRNLRRFGERDAGLHHRRVDPGHGLRLHILRVADGCQRQPRNPVHVDRCDRDICRFESREQCG